MKIVFFLALSIVSLQETFAQNSVYISGKILDVDNKALSGCIVTLKNKIKTYYAISNNDGEFKVSSIGEIFMKTKMEFSVKLIGYKEIDTSFVLSENKIHIGNIILQEKYTILDKVLVKAKPIVVNGDTTTLDVKIFSNNLDNNLEDVLRKMPGFDLNSSGDISFNGKPIENILIEGDELTKNYKQISKNIAPDMLDKVQMIDKYNSNLALKGLTNSGNQVMNLKLKNPKKLKFFGTAKTGIGIKDKQEIAANFFILKNKFKSLDIFAKNNTGESPYNEVTNDGNSSLLKDYDFDATLSPKYIQQDYLYNRQYFSNNSNTLFNHSNLLVLNNIYRINKYLDVKLFSDLYGDKINQFKNTVVTNLQSQNLSYAENINKLFRPLYFNSYLQLNYTTNKGRLLLAAGEQSKRYREAQKIIAPITYQYNIDNLFTRYSAGIFYTRRIDSLHAYEILMQNNNDHSSENANVFQNKPRQIDSVYNTIDQEQNLSSKINYNKNSLKYISKSNNSRISTFRLQNTNIISQLYSGLLLKDSAGFQYFPDKFVNNNYLHSNEVCFNYNTNFSIKKINISLDAGISYYNQKVNFENINYLNHTKKFYFAPALNFSYNFKKTNHISGNMGFTNETPDLSMQALNPVLSNYRSLVNTLNLSDKINSFKTNLIYTSQDVGKGQNLLFSWFHLSKFKGLISNIDYEKDFDYYQNFFSQKAQSLNNFMIDASQYIDRIRLGFNLKNNFLLYSNPSVSNNIIAFRKYFSYTGSMAIRPSFQKNINGNFGVEFNYNKDLNANTATSILSPFTAFSVSFSKNISTGTKLNFYQTNFLKSKQNYFLGDFFIMYKLLKGKADLKLNLNNFTNTHNIYSGYKTIFQEKSVISQNLPRYLLLEFRYHFK